GDTIVTIARKFNMTVADLYNDNQSTIGNNPTNVQVGMSLWIRGS
ncbi:MAG: LysM peptidoglycan-binding domain-containing protein, partial [Lachnospiraceae bacterium]|nr:LysM peptidoglycan-binding domain-containing protein [Lachnospiraceae bacterium]